MKRSYLLLVLLVPAQSFGMFTNKLFRLTHMGMTNNSSRGYHCAQENSVRIAVLRDIHKKSCDFRKKAEKKAKNNIEAFGRMVYSVQLEARYGRDNDVERAKNSVMAEFMKIQNENTALATRNERLSATIDVFKKINKYGEIKKLKCQNDKLKSENDELKSGNKELYKTIQGSNNYRKGDYFMLP